MLFQTLGSFEDNRRKAPNATNVKFNSWLLRFNRSGGESQDRVRNAAIASRGCSPKELDLGSQSQRRPVVTKPLLDFINASGEIENVVEAVAVYEEVDVISAVQQVDAYSTRQKVLSGPPL